LDAESAAEWEHSIPALEDLRYSITFRNLRDTYPYLPSCPMLIAMAPRWNGWPPILGLRPN
jgi:hypothetical protein